MSTDKKPLLSLCIPTFNRASFLEETLCSIAVNCRDLPCEIIISDNASNDNTSEIVTHFFDELDIQYFRNDTNIGPEKNLCRAIAAASGKYVWLLGDDDPLVEGICVHLMDMMKTQPELGYIFVPRKLVFTDLSPTPDGVQPAGLNGDLYFEHGRDLYQAYDGQIAGLIGFYGCNIILKKIWQDSFDELNPTLSNWFHVSVILNAIKDIPCAIAGDVGVQARYGNGPLEGIDSRIWIDYAVPVMQQAITWGYSKALCEQTIRTIFRAHALMYVFEKAQGKRCGNLLALAKELDCEKILKWDSIWMNMSFLPCFMLMPLLWIRTLLRKLRRK
jgi:glycosyltransferase involved in cell wall biosynthesis